MRTCFRHQSSTPDFHRLVIALIGVVAIIGGMAPPAHGFAAPVSVRQEQPQAVHEIIFPDVPGGFNGMKVGYTVTGAILGNPQDYGISMRSYQGRLGAGTLTRSQVASQLLRSDESHRRVIDGLYFAYLNREPETPGADYWLNELRTGRQSYESMAQAILSLPEFYGST